MTYPATRGLVVHPLIGPGAREAQTDSAVINREDFDGATSIVVCVQAGSGATTISATRVHCFDHATVSATASGMTAITSGHTSGMTFTASGIIGVEFDLRDKEQFLGFTLSSPNVATSGVNGLFCILTDGQTTPPTTAMDGFLNIRRIGS